MVKIRMHQQTALFHVYPNALYSEYDLVIEQLLAPVMSCLGAPRTFLLALC